MNSKELLSSYLKTNKEEHFNFVKDKDFVISTGSLIFDIEVGEGGDWQLVLTTVPRNKQVLERL